MSVYNDFTAFVLSGYNEQLFTNSLYKHLVNHCGFISENNKSFFYYINLSLMNPKIRFIDQFITGFGLKNSLWLTGRYGKINKRLCIFMRKHYSILKNKSDRKNRTSKRILNYETKHIR